MHRMTSSHFEGWLDKYGQAWERGDAEIMARFKSPKIVIRCRDFSLSRQFYSSSLARMESRSTTARVAASSYRVRKWRSTRVPWR